MAPPVENLSRETLASIFCELAHQDPQWPQMRAYQGPMTISAVCASWRRVALATPALWYRFTFDFSPLPGRAFLEQTVQRTVAARTWVARAGERALQLDLTRRPALASSPGPILCIGAVDPVKALVEENASRIAVLKLVLPGNLALSFITRIPGGFPLLTSLSIEPSAEFTFNTSANQFPLLQRLSIATSNSSLGRDQLRALNVEHKAVAWDKITTLRLDRVAMLPVLCSMLQHIPALVGLQLIVGAAQADTSTKMRGHTSLRHLKTLVLELPSYEAFRVVLTHLHFPALDALSLAQSACYGACPRAIVGGIPEAELFSVLTRSPNLSRLSLALSCPTHIIAGLETRAPHLSELRLCFDQALVDQLAAGSLRFPTSLTALSVLVFLDRSTDEGKPIPSTTLHAIASIAKLRLRRGALPSTLVLTILIESLENAHHYNNTAVAVQQECERAAISCVWVDSLRCSALTRRTTASPMAFPIEM
ncbi:hypothetical protein MKEN_00530900 [Mycena kentingensis (nom. inval.)]|nr:hypothetical protein MKEN_00530900 [Mycena kentingensis (nom. inval.)]